MHRCGFREPGWRRRAVPRKRQAQGTHAVVYVLSALALKSSGHSSSQYFLSISQHRKGERVAQSNPALGEGRLLKFYLTADALCKWRQMCYRVTIALRKGRFTVGRCIDEHLLPHLVLDVEAVAVLVRCGRQPRRPCARRCCHLGAQRQQKHVTLSRISPCSAPRYHSHRALRTALDRMQTLKAPSTLAALAAFEAGSRPGACCEALAPAARISAAVASLRRRGLRVRRCSCDPSAGGDRTGSICL